ncbi:LPS translocon maturation chaperone LptM [Paludibacterium denitrificans]|nr:lipoprotein [Paludibacterium denitrificans]HJV06084.1 lipoprotein [Chromobacteriaceae bacterium]
MACVALTLLLTACGYKGALYLPKKQAPTAPASAPANAPRAASAAH